MSLKKERLIDLKEEVYNAENVLDGIFIPTEFKDIPEINSAYTELLESMRNLDTLIDNVLDNLD